MDSRERVALSLAHEKPDRIPINFRATDQIIESLAAWLNTDYEDLLEYFNVDFREVIPAYVGPECPAAKDGTVFDLWGIGRRAVKTESGTDVQITHTPLKGIHSPEQILDYPWPKAEWFDFSAVKYECRDLEKFAISTPGIHCEGYHGVLHLLTYLFGMEEAMMKLFLEPELIKTTLGEILKFLTAYYERLLESAEGLIDFIFYKDDYGTQNGLLISREMFLEFFHPALVRLSRLAESRSAHLVLHSCGSVIDIIPDIIDSGVAVLDPIQVTAKNMDITVLKDRFGEHLTFHGGIDTQRLMPFGSLDEIKATAKHTIETLGERGGYFFSPAHRFQPDTPLENICELYKAALLYGRYE